MKTILIVGAGFSGTISAIELLRQPSHQDVHVIVVNRSGPMARGIAYGTQSPAHLLNVPAGNMSALVDEPNHFVEYCCRTGAAVTPGCFVPRQRYGDYLHALLAQVERAPRPGSRLSRLVAEVTSVRPRADRPTVEATFADGSVLAADQVLLAIGHYPARNPALTTPAFFGSPRYIRDPWRQGAFDGVGPRDQVLLLGTSLTTVDVSMQLLAAGPQRIVHAMSRRGLLPQAHRVQRAVPPSALAPLDLAGLGVTVREQVRAVRRQVKAAAALDCNWREVVAALRPLTHSWWETLDIPEKRRFLRHVQPFWDSHRHRVAPVAHGAFQAAVDAGTLRVCAARVEALDTLGDAVSVRYRPRGSRESRTLRVSHVVNCTGPESDLRQVADPLIRQLLADGLMQVDALGLGLEVGDGGELIGVDGRKSDRLFYVGPLLKARYWEATAVPELRVFARQFALNCLRSRQQHLITQGNDIMTQQDEMGRRARNRTAFTRMLGHLGRKEFDQFEGYLAENIFQDWPYKPIPSMADSLTGKQVLRDFIEKATSDFDPYNYTIDQFYDMADPDSLIIEYTSHTVYLPRAAPYSNQYLSIVRFVDEKIVYWREYVNPLIIKEALMGDFSKSVDERVSAAAG